MSDKSELLKLIEKFLDHTLVQSGKLTLYRGYNPTRAEILNETDFKVPMFIIMPHYEEVGYHLAWCKGCYGLSVEAEIGVVKLALSLLEDTKDLLPPLKKKKSKA